MPRDNPPDLARLESDRVDIGTRCEFDHFVLRHSGPHVGARHVEASRPPVVEHLASRRENEVHRHIVDARIYGLKRNPHTRHGGN
jgi:hypothetical protein